MAAENLLVDDGGDGEAVKAVGEGFPQLYVEPALACKNTRTLYEHSGGTFKNKQNTRCYQTTIRPKPDSHSS